MGSTFGKVRKYNVNSSGEPTPYKYNTIPDEEIKPNIPPPLPIDKVTSTAPNGRRTPHENAWKYDPKCLDPKESNDTFTAGYPPRIHPYYFGFHVTEDMQIPERYLHHYIKGENEEKVHKYPDSRKHSLTRNIDDSTSLPDMTMPSSTFVSIKPDSASDPNPKPHQKYYSADDINNLLKPLKFQNTTKLKQPLSYYSLPYQEAYNTPRYQALGNSLVLDTQCKCSHNSNELPKEFQLNVEKPPPYVETHLKSVPQSSQDKPHQTRNTLTTHHYSVSNPYLPNQLTQNQYKPSTPYTKYHTIHNDNRIPLHQRQEFRMNSPLESSPSPRYIYEAKHRTEPLVQRQYSKINGKEVYHTSNDDEINSNEHQTQTRKYRRRVFLREDPVSNPDEESLAYPEITTYPGRRSSHYCYTIPEEQTWPPPFSYSPAHSTGYRHH